MFLKISRSKAEDLLRRQIEKGKLLQRELEKCNSEEILNKLNGRFYNWEEFTKEVIKKIFPTDKETKEFCGSGFGIAVMRASFSHRIKKTIDDIEGDITKLEGLIERLEIYNEKKDEKEEMGNTIQYTLDSLHPRIIQSSSRLYNDKHYSQAIFEAFKQVNNFVKEKTEIKDRDGVPLMNYVFSPNNPILAFNDLKSQSDKDEQMGFMFLFKGAMLGIRNPKAHDNIIQRDSGKTLEYLSFASLLIRLTEMARKK